jgi:MmpS family membrane protein
MRKPVLILTALVFGAAGALACGFGDRSVQTSGSAPTMAPEARSTPSQATTFRLEDVKLPITFEVSGGVKADITYGFGLNQTPNRSRGASTPWTWTTTMSEPAIVATLTAQTTSTNPNATITCRIKIGDNTIEEHSARGAHALADCSTIPHAVTQPDH